MTDSEWSKFVEVPLSRFIEDFLPADYDVPEPESTGILDTMDDASVDGVYRHWNQTTRNVCASYTSTSVRTKLPQDCDIPNTIDGGLYLAGESPAEETHDWSCQRLSFTLVGEEMADIFTWGTEAEDKTLNSGLYNWAVERSKKIRNHLTENAMHVFARQQRCFHFTIFLRGLDARIIRWDRGGAVVSEKFHYKNQPRALRTCLWRFCRFTDEQQGHDPTAIRIEPGTEEYLLMDWAAKNGSERPCALHPWDMLERPRPLTNDERMDYARSTFEESLTDGWPRWKLSVCEEGPGGCRTMRWFLVCKPDAYNPDLFTRGTRGYVALDCETNHFVFLKDTWRVDVRHTAGRREGETLRMLASKSVRNIPTVMCHGDVLGQRTATYDYRKRDHPLCMPDGMLVELSHYRLVECEVGRPLALFEKSRDLVKVLSDCLLAHEDAFTRSNLLHRDISIGNMLIVYRTDEDGDASPHGLLIDWEAALPPSSETSEETQARGARQRMGTWRFISVRSQDCSFTPLVLQDDLESFFYVLLYCAIRWLPSNCPKVSAFIKDFFDACGASDGDLTCNAEKLMCLQLGDIIVLGADHTTSLCFGYEGKKRHPINAVYTGLLNWFSAHHRHSRRPTEIPRTEPGREPEVIPRADNPFLTDPDCVPSPSIKLVFARKLPERIQRDEHLAAKLETHQAMSAFLSSAHRLLDWSSNDRVPDRVTFPLSRTASPVTRPPAVVIASHIAPNNLVPPRTKPQAPPSQRPSDKKRKRPALDPVVYPRQKNAMPVVSDIDGSLRRTKRAKRIHPSTLNAFKATTLADSIPAPRASPTRSIPVKVHVPRRTQVKPPHPTSTSDSRATPTSGRLPTRSLRCEDTSKEAGRRSGHMVLRSRPKRTQRFGC